MRWVSLVIWFVLAAALGLGIMHVETVTSASPTATAYPVPTNTFTPVPRATPDWVAKNFLYLPRVESRAPGVPGPAPTGCFATTDTPGGVPPAGR